MKSRFKLIILASVCLFASSIFAKTITITPTTFFSSQELEEIYRQLNLNLETDVFEVRYLEGIGVFYVNFPETFSTNKAIQMIHHAVDTKYLYSLNLEPLNCSDAL
jgi:hypothetical protein